MTDKPVEDPNRNPSDDYDVGYRKPPKQGRFTKGKSGNPKGRPKHPSVGVDIKKILDSDQIGRNGEVISKREAIVIRIVNDALAGNHKAFSRFLKLLDLAGLKKLPPSGLLSPLGYELEKVKASDFKRNFGLPRSQWT